MRRAVYAGSFDPITLGHLWMVEQGRALFDELIVAIGINPDKRYLFSLNDRLAMLREVTAGFANVRIASYENMFLVHYAEQVGAGFILRGIRNEQDYGHDSSSFVKGLVGPKGLAKYVPPAVHRRFLERTASA